MELEAQLYYVVLLSVVLFVLVAGFRYLRKTKKVHQQYVEVKKLRLRDLFTSTSSVRTLSVALLIPAIIYFILSLLVWHGGSLFMGLDSFCGRDVTGDVAGLFGAILFAPIVVVGPLALVLPEFDKQRKNILRRFIFFSGLFLNPIIFIFVYMVSDLLCQ